MGASSSGMRCIVARPGLSWVRRDDAPGTGGPPLAPYWCVRSGPRFGGSAVDRRLVY